MPTAGRLAGAILFGLFGWYMATLCVRFFPQEVAPDFFLPSFVAIGLIVGWRICGKRAGHGYNPAIGIGLTTSFAMGFWVLFVLGFAQMLENAFDMKYRGPMDSVVGVFAEMVNYGTMMFDIPLIVTLFAGGVICAWITEVFGQRLP